MPVVIGFGHLRQARQAARVRKCAQFGVATDVGAVDENLRNGTAASGPRDHIISTTFVDADIDLIVRDQTLAEQALRLHAVRTSAGTVDSHPGH